ncbi:MAG: PP2C family protein-serine/threonine phosphatase [Mycobacteriales bacterium]
MGLLDHSGKLLPALNQAMPARLVPVLREFLQQHAQARDVEVLLADYEMRELRQLTPRQGAPRTLHVEGTAAGECFTNQMLVSEPAGTGTAVLVPLSLRAERLGVMQVLFDRPVSPEMLRGLQEVALETSYVLVACGSCSDVVEVARRAEPLNVAAEMQWNLQPLRAFATDRFSIAGQLIPAYEVGGDCYDYNVDVAHLDLSSLDAMGHGVQASLLAALTTAVMRNARRAGDGPVAQIAQADRQLLERFGGDQFVTALAMRLDLADGTLETVNAGHPQPWRVRDGRASQVDLAPQLPVGMFEATSYRPQTFRLEPGDRLVIVTDGVLEAGAPGEEFGEDRLAGMLLATAHLTPHQCVAEVLRTLRTYAPKMHDDATVICLDWFG